MLASDLAEQVPTITREATGAQAARLIAEYRLNGLVVVDAGGLPVAVIPGSQLLSIVLPQYVRDDPKLAHVFDEEAADELCQTLNDVTIGELLDAKRVRATDLRSVLPEDTMIEVASVMDEGHLPLVAVRDRDGSYHGVVTMSRVMAAIATISGHDSDLIRRRLERDIITRGQST